MSGFAPENNIFKKKYIIKKNFLLFLFLLPFMKRITHHFFCF